MVFDLPPLDERLRGAAGDQVVAAARLLFGPALRGALIKGSALKGGFIPGYSDIDIHLFCDPAVMRASRELRADLEAPWQRALSAIDPVRFTAWRLQVYCIDAVNYPEDWLRPPPGTYEIIHGEAPAAFSRPAEPAEHRRHALEDLRTASRFIRQRCADIAAEPGATVARTVRRIGMDLKSMPYLVLVVVVDDPTAVWSLPWGEVIARTEALVWPRREPRRFAEGLLPWPPPPAGCRELLALSRSAAEAVDGWLDHRPG